MTRDEYLTVLETESVTPNQRGAIMSECDRLGLTDRAERLAVLAALLGLDDLGSTANLTMGQAGQLVNALEHTASRAGLPRVGQADDDSGSMSIADAIGRILLMVGIAAYGDDLQGESADIGLNTQRLGA